MSSKITRTLVLGATGPDVEDLQRALNARARDRGLPIIGVDGEYGPQTDISSQRVSRALGVREREIARAGCSEHEQRTTRYPSGRSPLELVRARQRKRAARERKATSPVPLRVRAWREMNELIVSGVVEIGGNNRGAAVEKIIRTMWGQVGEPWCGDTVGYCYLRAGSKMVTRSWAAVRLLLAGGKVESPLMGHIARYDFWVPGSLQHTGLFKEWAPQKGRGWFWAGEGNTARDGARSDSEKGGDGVHLRLRHISQVHDFRKVTR